ncbi:ABC transporter ATP-binding protein, partial [Helcococcus ovis]
MIEIKNLQKVFDNKFEALKSINLQIEEGDLVCLLGPSGCGKTTILNLIAGLLDPTNGDIKFDGKSVVDLHPKDRGIGLVFQNYALYPHMTVLENIMFPLTVGKNKIAKSEAIKIARKYMKITSIEELEEKKPGQMSGGQQQRVAITRALVQNPKVLLLDEPLSNLDARLRLKIREEIRLLVKELGITTIFVTHDQEEALSISDKIVIMDKGVVQQYDKPYNLYLDPVNLFVAKFMGNPVIN